MARESQLRQYVIKGLGAYGHIIAVENTAGVGTPDIFGTIAGCSFWLELKKLDAWPKRASTVIKIPHYTPAQKIWSAKERAAGGGVWCLVKVEREYFLFWGEIPETDAAGWRRMADLRWSNSVVWVDLARRLRNESQQRRADAQGDQQVGLRPAAG